MTFHNINPDLLIDQVRVVLVGCGGNGSQMLTGLARLHSALRAQNHPGGLTVEAWDPDEVTEANMGRQLFSPGDVGRNKAQVLVNRINLYYGLNWTAQCRHFRRAQAGQIMDILITCVDSARARREIHQHLWGQGQHVRYWLDLGNRQQDGQVILGNPCNFIKNTKGVPHDLRQDAQRLACVTEVFPELLDETLQEDDQPSCSLAEALEKQDLFVNDHVSRWALHLLWTLFRQGGITHHGYMINLADGVVNPIPVPEEG